MRTAFIFRAEISQTTVSFTRKTSSNFNYKLCSNLILRYLYGRGPAVQFECKLYFHHYSDYIFTQGLKILGFIRYIRSRVSSGSIVSDYGLDDRAIGVPSPAGAKDFSSNLCVQTGSGAHPASCPMGTGDPFPGG
jgi:hypothetical protein